jgi:hypothetical protein
MGAPPPVLGKPGKPAKLAKAVAVCSELGTFVDLGLDVGFGFGFSAQIGPLMMLESIDTSPVCARARPFNLAPVSRLMDVSARIFPMNLVVVWRVAELTTLHHTLHGSPPVTDEPDDVLSSDADLKIQTPDDPLSVRFPDSPKAPAQ